LNLSFIHFTVCRAIANQQRNRHFVPSFGKIQPGESIGRNSAFRNFLLAA